MSSFFKLFLQVSIIYQLNKNIRLNVQYVDSDINPIGSYHAEQNFTFLFLAFFLPFPRVFRNSEVGKHKLKVENGVSLL